MTLRHSIPKQEIGLRFAVRALKNRNYRLFFGGQGISLIGTWMQNIAMSWLIYRLTGSPFYLGLVGFTGQVPTFLFASFAGVLADRFNRRRLLILTQTLSMVPALLLAGLAFSGRVEPWHIVALSIFLGCVNAFDIPIRQSFFVEIVESKRDLGNAIAMNSFIFNSARLVGPSIAGILIGLIGESICFLINGLSFFAVIFALVRMRVPRKKKRFDHPPVLQGMREGFTYAFGFLPIKYIILFVALISFVGIPYFVLLPIFAKDVLHGGPSTLGFLMGAAGAGALTGALYLALRKTVLGLGKLIVITAPLFGISLIAFSLSRNVTLSMALMFMAGLSMLVEITSCNTIVQTIVDEDKRGRVVSLFATAYIGVTPFGNLLAGIMADKIGAPYTLMIMGLLCIAGAILFTIHLPSIRKAIRPIYVKMGIVKELTVDIQ
ncbi:MAG TPA: MFS transporter [Syntrophorhabdaceae bacterium]|jgi:MFS family permease